jgi:hypothetical protein
MAVLAQLPEVRTPMAHTMEIRPGMSPREIYEQTDWPEHMHVELLDGRLVMTGGAPIEHARIIVRLLLKLDTAELAPE